MFSFFKKSKANPQKELAEIEVALTSAIKILDKENQYYYKIILQIASHAIYLKKHNPGKTKVDDCSDVKNFFSDMYLSCTLYKKKLLNGKNIDQSYFGSMLPPKDESHFLLWLKVKFDKYYESLEELSRIKKAVEHEIVKLEEPEFIEELGISVTEVSEVYITTLVSDLYLVQFYFFDDDLAVKGIRYEDLDSNTASEFELTAQKFVDIVMNFL